MLSRRPLVSLLIVWCTVVTAGMWALYAYEHRAGRRADAPPEWPDDCPLTCRDGEPRLLVFVHPRCPCTTATVDELERLLSLTRTSLQAAVVFLHPAETAADWHETSLWRRVQQIPGVRIVDDRDSAITRRFAAQTSGQTLLYDAGGKLVFNGGITPSRGHAGDSVGRNALLTLLSPASKSSPPVSSSPCCNVFGCPLMTAERGSDTFRPPELP